MSPNSGQISTDVSTPTGAYASARFYCQAAVSMQREVSGTIESALDVLGRRGQFGSWLIKLWKGHAASIHLDRYERLVSMVEEMTAERRRQIEHLDHIISATRGKRNADIEGSRGTDIGPGHTLGLGAESEMARTEVRI